MKNVLYPLIFLPIWLIAQEATLNPVNKNGKWGYENKDGKMVIPAKFDKAEPFNDDYALVELKGKKGIINESGKEILAISYDNITKVKCTKQQDVKKEITPFYWLVEKTNKKGLFVYNGKKHLAMEYEDIKLGWAGECNVLLTVASKNGKYAIYKENGTRSSDFIYDSIEIIAEDGIGFKAKKDGKTILLDEEGKQKTE